jgi:hypothetical protein
MSACPDPVTKCPEYCPVHVLGTDMGFDAAETNIAPHRFANSRPG